MRTDEVLVAILMYVVLPLWLAAGFADYICHRASHIERTSGWKESMLHLVQFGEMAVPVLAALLRNQLGRDPDHDGIPDSPSGDCHLGCAIRLGDTRGFPDRAARPQRARNAALYRTAVGYCATLAGFRSVVRIWPTGFFLRAEAAANPDRLCGLHAGIDRSLRSPSLCGGTGARSPSSSAGPGPGLALSPKPPGEPCFRKNGDANGQPDQARATRPQQDQSASIARTQMLVPRPRRVQGGDLRCN